MASKKPFSKVAGSAYKQAAGLAVGAILASQIKSMTRNLLPGIPGRLLAAAVPGAAGVFLISQKSETGQNIGLGMVTSSATELATLGIEVVTGQTSLTGGSDAGDGTAYRRGVARMAAPRGLMLGAGTACQSAARGQSHVVNVGV